MAAQNNLDSTDPTYDSVWRFGDDDDSRMNYALHTGGGLFILLL